MTFLARFTDVVGAHGERPALEHNGAMALTYQALAEAAGELSDALRSEGPGPEDVVALEMEASPAWVVGMLGTWLAGAAFMPLPPAWPAARKRAVLGKAGARVRLTSGATPGAVTVSVVESARGVRTGPGDDAPLAYVVFTSGSSGEPKGVAVTHRGIPNLVEAQIEAFALHPDARTLWYSSPAFDASISDVLTTLGAGATLCTQDGLRGLSPAALLGLCRQRRITHLDVPPAILARMDVTTAPPSLETVFIGGEVTPAPVVRRWARRVRLVNIYGPAEATICTSLSICGETWDRPLIGTPILGMEVALRDPVGGEVAVGETGEIYISGPGVARGYVGAPELTAQRFVTVDGVRCYRTGDLGVRHTDGAVGFVGRVDRQLKVNAMLVAPEEIEARLRIHPAVDDVAVVPVVVGERMLLAAWIVTAAEATDAALVAHTAESLPAWMVPHRWFRVDALPRTETGKVDYPQLEARARRPAVAPPEADAAGGLEQALLAACREVLRDETLTATDDFFAAGGDSLGAVEVAALCESRGLPVSPAALNAHRTVRELAAHVTEVDGRSMDVLREDAARIVGSHAAAGGHTTPAVPLARAGRILVTGATGFLGRHVARELLRQVPAAQLLCLVRDEGRLLPALAAAGAAPADLDRVKAVTADSDFASLRGCRRGLDRAAARCGRGVSLCGRREHRSGLRRAAPGERHGRR